MNLSGRQIWVIVFVVFLIWLYRREEEVVIDDERNSSGVFGLGSVFGSFKGTSIAPKKEVVHELERIDEEERFFDEREVIKPPVPPVIKDKRLSPVFCTQSPVCVLSLNGECLYYSPDGCVDELEKSEARKIKAKYIAKGVPAEYLISDYI